MNVSTNTFAEDEDNWLETWDIELSTISNIDHKK